MVRVTEEFLPLLRESKASSPGRRIVFVSATFSSLTWGSDASSPQYANNYPIYPASKSALNMRAVYYTNTLREEKIAVLECCPGYCAINLNGYNGTDDPRNGATSITRVVLEGKNMDVTGTFTDNNGNILWWSVTSVTVQILNSKHQSGNRSDLFSQLISHGDSVSSTSIISR